MGKVLYNNPITREKVIATFNNEDVYKISFDNDFDLVRIIDCDLFVNVTSLLDGTIKNYRFDNKDFVKMYLDGRITKI